jgi:hypothetical protein
MGRKFVVRRGREGEPSTGEGWVPEVGEREISSRRSAMDFVSSGRELAGSGESLSLTGWEEDGPKRGAVLIRMARGARAKI